MVLNKDTLPLILMKMFLIFIERKAGANLQIHASVA
jgi:hypothetical protein